MLTKKEFIANYSSNPELAKKVLKAGGLGWALIKEMKWDAYAANTGAVPGMIYYSDTVKFAKRNFRLIIEALRAFEAECGPLQTPAHEDGEEQYYNWLTWFAWENTMGEVLNYLEA